MSHPRNSNGESTATRVVNDGEVGGEAPYEKIIIYDRRLRDGEQASGFSMSQLTKLRMAHQLVALGVDVIEAGFPAAGFSEMGAVRAIAIETSGVIISALARMNRRDVDLALDAASAADRPRVHVSSPPPTFTSGTSPRRRASACSTWSPTR